MGRFYRTDKPTFVDNNIYKPNLELMSMLAQAEVKSDALKKSFASMAEYDVLPTFKSWQKDLDKEVSSLNDNVTPIVEQLIEDPNSLEAKRKLKSLTDSAKDLYSSGKVGQMARHFNEYQKYRKELLKDIESTKDEREKGFKRQRLAEYEKYIGNSLGDHYEEGWSRRDLNPYFDAQKDLKETIDVEKMKQSFDYIGKPVKVIKKGNQLVPLNSVNGTYDSETGKIIDEDGKAYDILETRDEKLRALGLPFQYYRDDLSTEGYLQEAIRDIAFQRLNNPAFLGMIRDDYEMFGRGAEGESFEDYLKKRVLEEANMFASQHPKLTKYKENRTDYTDDYSKQSALAAQKHKYKLAEKAADYDYNYKLAVKKGDIKQQEEALILGVPEAVVTPAEQKEIYDKWYNLYNAKLNGGKYDPLELAKLSSVFEPIIEKDGDYILKGNRDDPKNYKTPEAKRNRIISILRNINKLDDPDWEVEEKTHWDGNLPTYTEEPTKKRSNTMSAKRALNKKFGDFNKYMAENLEVITNYETIGTDDESNRILDIINQHSQLVVPSTRVGGLTINDSQGTRRDLDRVDVDSDWYSTGKTKNPLGESMRLAGVTSLRELIDKGYYVAAHTPTDKNEITVLWTPTSKFLDLAEVERSSGEDIFSFKTTHSGIGNQIYTPSKNPEKNELYLKSLYGQDYDNVTQKLNYDNALKKKNYKEYIRLYPTGKPLLMSGYKNLTFGIKDEKDGGFTITAKNVKTGESYPITITRQNIIDMNLDKNSAIKATLISGIYNSSFSGKLKELENK